MTNAEKYKEIFGFENPNCPTWNCPSCPVFEDCRRTHSQYDALSLSAKWWNSEYKEPSHG